MIDVIIITQKVINQMAFELTNLMADLTGWLVNWSNKLMVLENA